MGNKLTNLFLLLEMIKQMSKNQLKISLKMLIKINNKTTKKIMIKMTKRENHNQNKEKAIRTRKTEKHSIQTNERKHLKISKADRIDNEIRGRTEKKKRTRKKG